jgi:hypothetical protein
MVPVQLAQAQPAAATAQEPNGAAVVARFPPTCALDYVQIAAEQGGRILLPQVVSASALRKQVIGADLALSVPELGVLVLRDFVAAATGSSPPVLVLADGASLTAFQVLAWPDSTLAVAECMTAPAAEVAAASPPTPEPANVLAQVAPGAGVARSDAPASDAVAQIVREGGRGAPSEFAPIRSGAQDADRAAGDGSQAARSDGRSTQDSFSPSSTRGADAGPAAPFDPLQSIADAGQQGRGGDRDIDLVRNLIELINTLDLGSQNATAVLPTSEKTVYSPVGAIFDAGLINSSEGLSIYRSSIGQLLGPPNLANVTVVPDPLLLVRLEAENTNARNIVGVYQFTADGRITDVDILWLNASMIPGTTRLLPDFLGQFGERNTDLLIPPETSFGYFTIADGGGGFNGVVNQALVLDLFADLRINPRTFGWADNIDIINQHIRFDPEARRIEIEVDPGVFRNLSGDTFFSHDPRLNTDFRLDLSRLENAHTITGQADGEFWIGFEDTPFRGAALRNGDGSLRALIGNDLDYNDIVLSSVIDYPEVAVPAAFQPLGSLGKRFEAASDFVTSAVFSVSGLGPDGVGLALGRLAPGFALTAVQVDRFGNGAYALKLPGPVASTSAVVDELNKVLIAVSQETPQGGRSAVSTSFALTDIYGATAVATSSLSFAAETDSPDSRGEAAEAAAPLAPPVILASLAELQPVTG